MPKSAIGVAFTTEERDIAISKARDVFSHDMQQTHNDEIASGADSALTKHLTFLAFHAQQQTDSASQKLLESLLAEISLTCDALESVYRASSSHVGTSFDRLGKELMQLLVGVIDNELERRRRIFSDYRNRANSRSAMDPEDEDPFANMGTSDGDLLLHKATKILGHFARVGKAIKPMAQFPGLINVLLHLTNMRPYAAVPWEARLSALWTLANLACNPENMTLMACTPGLIGSLVESASRRMRSGDSLEKTMEILRSKSIASRAVLNLSWSPENKILLADHVNLIDLLVALSVYESASYAQSRTIRDIQVATRKHAIGALRNLAAAPLRVKLRMCEFKDGQLLNVLSEAASNDPDQTVRDRALAAIHNLAARETAQIIAKHPTLMNALRVALLSKDHPIQQQQQQQQSSSSSNDDVDPQKHASGTLAVLQRAITPTMDSFSTIQNLLTAVRPTTSLIAANHSGQDLYRGNSNQQLQSSGHGSSNKLTSVEATAV